MPAEMPVTTPDVETVAIAVLLLDHVPDDVASLKVMVEPAQVEDGPAIAAGAEITDNVAVTVHPVVPSEYVIVSMPTATPVTTPLSDPMLATIDVLLLHTPPEVALVSAVVAPEQTDFVPRIAAGLLIEVLEAIAEQPPTE